MKGSVPVAYSNLEFLLARRNLSVPALQRKLESAGVPVNIKSLYRLTEGSPLQKIDLRIAAAICQACGAEFSELISFEKPKAQLQRLDVRTQSRLDSLMAKNNEGQLTTAERKEFTELADQAHRISMQNARMLLSQRPRSRRHRVKNRRKEASRRT